MSRRLFPIVLLACLITSSAVQADPIHAIADAAYWHHDSGWVFPEKIAEFVRVGIPQDVAGSRDAVAYYARVIAGSRIVASVDVYPADSAAVQAMMADRAGNLSSEEPFDLQTTLPLSGTRIVGSTLLYFVAAGEWCVRIRVEGANAGLLPMLDSFVRGQRWDTLSAAPTPR